MLRPPTLRPRGEKVESTHRSLSALVVSVKEIDRHLSPIVDRLPGLGKSRFVRVAEDALPEAAFTGGNVQIPRESSEPLKFTSGEVTHLSVPVEGPTIQHGQTVTDVSQRDREIDDFLGCFRNGSTTCNLHPMVVCVTNLLGWVFEAGWNQDRTDARSKGSFCGQARPGEWNAPT